MFENCDLPVNNERAMEILTWVSKLWEENSWIRGNRRYHEKVPMEVKNVIISMAISSPELFEEFQAEEYTLSDLLEAAKHYAS